MSSGYPYIYIVGKRNCPYTHRAIRLCNENKTPYTTDYVGSDAEALVVTQRYNHFTFPITTVRYPGKEYFVGGSDSLEEYFKSGSPDFKL